MDSKEKIEQDLKEFADKLPQMIQERLKEEAAYARSFKDPDDPSLVSLKDKEWLKQEVENFKKFIDSDLGKWIIEDLK